MCVCDVCVCDVCVCALLQKVGSKARNRFFLLFGLGLLSVFGSRRAIVGGASLAGAGALGVLTIAFVAAQGWDGPGKVSDTLGQHILLPCFTFLRVHEV